MKISIIIPTFNRSASLKITVASLLALNPSPRDHEIIIVDNGSTDDTRAVAEAIIKSTPFRYISTPNLFPDCFRVDTKGHLNQTPTF